MANLANWRRNSFVLLQNIMPRRLLTRLIYRLSHIRLRPLKNIAIKSFISAFRVDISEAKSQSPNDYANFNEFFTRSLSTGARPIAAKESVLISPCDGRVSQCGSIIKGTIIQAKGLEYSVDELLAGSDDARRYENGKFMTIYLAPYDYHRVHSPLAATLVNECAAGLDLYSVNEATAATVPKLFVKNERRVFSFDSPCGRFALVMVGAMNVGSITTVWGGEQRAGFGEKTRNEPSSDASQTAVSVNKGDLLGWFNMGSTVIVLAENGLVLSTLCAPGNTVRMGQALGHYETTT